MGNSHNPQGSVDIAYLHLDYGGGLAAHLHLSWLSPVKVRRTIVAGTKQSLIFDDLDQEAKIKLYDQGVAFDVTDMDSRQQLLVSYRKGDMRAPMLPAREALTVEMAEVAGVLRGTAVSRSPGEQGLAVVRVLEAAARSLARAGETVSVT